ncbi:PTS fructose transporter subunit IIA [Tersicoccus phoenicis]|uniref:PTS fructose transporter subunit IIA n=1 Tax=Tersicoccus phoenicis TaxID=554083 RepID=A0A1R1L6D1_9MICC|nr:PTS sugar transporter subunit IIA [Tersicoccus phoenicis]OMH23090.1 PTS fructose transporter subunit IIA [Tersicoccus phoenicis]
MSGPRDGTRPTPAEVDALRLYDEGLTRADLVLLDIAAEDRADAVGQLTDLLVRAGRVTDAAAFTAAVGAREHQMATGLPGGVGLPHARSAAVTQPSLAVGITRFGQRVDFGGADGPADIILLLGTPAGSLGLHLEVLAGIARSMALPNVRESLRRAYDAEVIAELVNSTFWFPPAG